MAQTPWERWNSELEAARKIRGYKGWVSQGKNIVKRYRDQRTDTAEYTDAQRSAEGEKFNILWSNIQTLMPAVFAKTPKPVVERRYLDRDEVGRTASVILQRALIYEVDTGTFYDSVKRAVLDRLLPGRGIVWVRYEPTFRTVQTKAQESIPDDDGGVNGGSAGVDDAGGISAGKDMGGEPEGAGDDSGLPEAAGLGEKESAIEEEKIYECCPVDYIDWEDYLCSPARTDEEVWWKAKRVYLDRAQLVARFGKKGESVKLDWTPAETKENSPSTTPGDTGNKAKIWEIWDKKARKVYWHTEADNSLPSGEELDTKDDPLKLECFWPTPKPLCATLTNESIVPVPDYHEYQDQASELDELTGRISALTRAIKVAGVYDASIPELQRIFQEGKENELVGVDNMAEFASKAGANGMGHIWLLPIVDMAATLLQLYQARDQVKQILFELTGISDIVRGQSGEGNAKTATEQRIKGQFASLRLNDMRTEVARFVRDVLRIMGEIISEHYSARMLYQVSSYEQYAKEQFLPMAGSPAPPPPDPGMMGHNGGPPMTPDQPPVAPQGGMGAGGEVGLPGQPPAPLPPPPPMMGGLEGIPMLAPLAAAAPPPSPAAKAAELFAKSIALLKNDKLRGFRVDIETDSLIEPDEQATQQARTELLGAISQFLPQAIQAGMVDPKLKPLLGQLLLFFLRGFKAGRDIEGMFEQFIDDMQKEAKNPQPKPPTPEEIKANAEMAKQKMEGERMQMQAGIDQKKAEQDFAIEQAKAKMEMEKQQMELQVDREKLNMEREKMAMEMQATQQKQALDAQGMEMKSAHESRAAELDAQHNERQATLDRESQERDAAMKEREAKLASDAAEKEAAEKDNTITELKKIKDEIAALVKKATAPKRIIRDPKTNRATGIETIQ